MRKHPHTKEYTGRRGHGLTPRKPPPPTVLEKAASRRLLYMHSSARQMEVLRTVLSRRPT